MGETVKDSFWVKNTGLRMDLFDIVITGNGAFTGAIIDPPVIDSLAVGACRKVVVTVSVPDGAMPGSYKGEIAVVADKCADVTEQDGASDKISAEYTVNEAFDLDVDNNDQNVVKNVMNFGTLWVPSDDNHEPLPDGAKTEYELYFSVVNPGPNQANVDPEDGPGNSGLSSITQSTSFSATGINVGTVLWTGNDLPYNSRKVGSVKVTVAGNAQPNTYNGEVTINAGSTPGNPATTDKFAFVLEIKATGIKPVDTLDAIANGAAPNPVSPDDNEVEIFVPTDNCQTVQIMIYNLAGLLVKDFGEMQCAGIPRGHVTDFTYIPDPVVTWDLQNDNAEPVASGMYIVVVNYDGEKEIKRFKIMVIR